MIARLEAVGPNETIIHTKSDISGTPGTVRVRKRAERVMQLLNSDRPIQEIFPELSPDDRERCITGMTPDEWNTVSR